MQNFLWTFGCLKPFLLWALTTWGCLSNGLMNVVRLKLVGLSKKISHLQPTNFNAIFIYNSMWVFWWSLFSITISSWDCTRGCANYVFNISSVLEFFQALNTLSYSIDTVILYRFSSLWILFFKVENAFSTLFIFNVAEEWSFLVHSYLLLYFNAHTIEIHSVNYAKIIIYFTSFRVWYIQILFLFFDLHLWPSFYFHRILLGLFWRYLLIRSSLIQSEGAIYWRWSIIIYRLIIGFCCVTFTVSIWFLLFNSWRLLIIVDNLIRFTLYFRLILLLMSGPDLLFH